MTDVRVLELAGDGDGPRLRLLQERLEDLAGADARPEPPRYERQPRFRLLQLCTPDDPGDWGAVQALKERAQRLLTREDLFRRLIGGEVVQLEVTGAPRELPGVWEAMRAQAQLRRSMFVLQVDHLAPNDVTELQLRALRELWQRMLEQPAARPRRARPAQPAPAGAAADATIAALLADANRFLDSVAVGQRLSGQPEHANPKMVTTRARRAGTIFGAWDGNAFRYPAFQFDAAGQPHARLAELLAVLPRDEDGEVGNDAALWLFAPDAALVDRTPAQVFVDDPARVIALARQRRDGDDALD